MAIRNCEIQISGSSWTFNTIPGGIKLWTAFGQFSKIVGEPLARAAQNLEADVSSDGFGIAVRAFTDRLAEPDSWNLVQTLLTGLRKNGKIVNFEDEFSANLGVLIQLVVFAIKENFESFLDAKDAVGSLMGSLQK